MTDLLLFFKLQLVLFLMGQKSIDPEAFLAFLVDEVTHRGVGVFGRESFQIQTPLRSVEAWIINGQRAYFFEEVCTLPVWVSSLNRQEVLPPGCHSTPPGA